MFSSMCPSVGLACTIAFVSDVDWRLCKEQRGIAPHIKQLGLGVPSSHISLFLGSLSIAQPQGVLLFYPIVPKDWSPSFPFPHISVLHLMLFPNYTLELGGRTGWPAHTPTSVRGKWEPPFTLEHDSCSLPLASVAFTTHSRKVQKCSVEENFCFLHIIGAICD